MAESNSLVVVEQHREAAVEAQARGDPGAANEAYALEQAAIAEPPPVETVGADALSPNTDTDTIMAGLAAVDPDGARELEDSWGVDIATNLGFADWAASRYFVGGEIPGFTPDADLVRVGAIVGRGVHSDIRAGARIGMVEPISSQLAEEFFANWPEDEAAGVAQWRASVPDVTMRSQLGAIKAVMRRYHVSSGDVPDSLAFWRAALPAAWAIVNDLSVGDVRLAPDTAKENEMIDLTEDDFEDALAAHRSKIADAQARGDSKAANRLHVAEQQMIAQHHGTGPIVDGRRTA